MRSIQPIDINRKQRADAPERRDIGHPCEGRPTVAGRRRSAWKRQRTST
ncbi:hypothetical protein FHS55_000921 [Angulomicrobium tetraedrale]|uniref:Uncharacterized protein n=1 Tax=Ancylobacter tetraedralis TaxID=217068 RepID=A0A839Z855_9HYPH|nr:hypothetical protein [Ancylobacter tetraedralis]MBB3770335.1 hypothetical protein [Ancylobacter tetraedralis]